MATRGDLFIREEKERGNTEEERVLIKTDAYPEGMQRALEKVMASNLNCSLLNRIIVSGPEMFELDNTNREGGYTYQIDAIKNTIKAEYKTHSQYKHFFEGSIEEFISMTFSS